MTWRGSLDVVKDWRQKGKNGSLLVPEIYAAGPLLDGPNPMWDGSIGINSPDHVPQIVDSLIAEGVDFLKVYSLLPRDIYFALATYAQERNFPFVGHVPLKVSPEEAATTGMKSQEHLLEIVRYCAGPDPNPPASFKQLRGLDHYVARQLRMFDRFDQQKAEELYEIYVEHKIWHTPTLSLWFKNAWFESEWKKDSALYDYLPPYMRTYWTPEVNDHLKYRNHEGFLEVKKREYQLFLSMVKDMQAAGVKLMCGTDMGANPLCFPGIGVHNELEHLVKAGLSPGEALQTATLNPTQFLEIDADFGTVEKGKIADLVILSSNPLEDIQHVREVHTVIKRGVVYDQEEREKRLEEIVTKLRDTD